ncbi:magnesium/cobalt transporter CorA [Actinopolymorpha pittospori]|uniref:Magnesium transport protein CorA n=1 Tax=Actinopolymorpha pittospori TaxID=648752 RepID=A0A927N4C6_9ACTN|nr:magnesium/cobalt transporter CorA [Actinopolymorpha pittospori]MBE1611497.1 magnesium transporter [Actinopolymorpha pittospori]
MTVVDNAIYVGGERVEPETLEQTYELIRDRRGMGWIGLFRPTAEEIASVAQEFGLHPLAVEDAVHAHQRPKLERYGDTLFVVLRPARYVDSPEIVEVGELHVFLGKDFVVTIRHSAAPELAPVRKRLEAHPELLRCGPEAILYAILDRIVDDYVPVLRGLGDDIEEIEAQVFGGQAGVTRRIYELSREVIEFQRACQPLVDVVDALSDGFDKYAVDVELRRKLRDVHDHVVRVVERVEAFRQLLASALTVNASVVAQRQNEEITRLTEATFRQSEEVKRISGWAAILFAPTLVGTVYGMNFTHMPELHWTLGYPFAVVLMFCVSVILYVVFKFRGWL